MNSAAIRRVALVPLMVAAAPIDAQAPSQMNVGVQNQAEAPPRNPELTPAQQLELLRIEEARRERQRRGLTIDCAPERAQAPMTDLERENWRLRCGR